MTSPQAVRTDVHEVPTVSGMTARDQWTFINAAGPPTSLGRPPMQSAAHARLLLPSPNHASSRPSSTASESGKRRGKPGLKPFDFLHTDGLSHSDICAGSSACALALYVGSPMKTPTLTLRDHPQVTRSFLDGLTTRIDAFL